MTRYLIDIRQMGPVRHQIHALSAHLEEKFPIRDRQVVPHITLAGPFSTGDEERLIRDFTRVCENLAGIPQYRVGGYGFFDTSRVVFVTIIPDDTLRQFRAALSEALLPYCTLRAYDRVPADAFRFHSTLAMKLDWLTFQRIKWFIRRQEPVVHRPHPVRVTLLKNSRILCEYDFARHRMLTGAQARSRATLMRDRDSLKPWGDDPGI